MSNEENYILVDNSIRKLDIPSSILSLGVQYDKDVNVLYFKVPRYYNDLDLSKFTAHINYVNANNQAGMFIVPKALKEIEEDHFVVPWIVGADACRYAGETSFSLGFTNLAKESDALEEERPIPDPEPLRPANGPGQDEGTPLTTDDVDWNDTLLAAGNVIQEFHTQIYKLPVLKGLEPMDENYKNDNSEYSVVEELLVELNRHFANYANRIDTKLQDAETTLTTNGDKALKTYNDNAAKALETLNTTKTKAVEDITTAKTNSLNEINTARANAVNEITTDHNSAVTEITTKHNTAVTEINNAKAGGVDAINQASTSAQNAIEQSKTNALNEIATKHTESVTDVEKHHTDSVTDINKIHEDASTDLKKIIHDQAVYLNEMLDWLHAEIEAKADKSAVNGIKVVKRAQDMTDSTVVYIYMGNEAGYTAGSWYYNDGGNWVAGGVYNSQGIVTDKDLVADGVAADGKATGDRFKVVDEILRHQFGASVTPAFEEENGYLDSTDGLIKKQEGFYTSEFLQIPHWATKIYTPITTYYEKDGLAFYNENMQFISGFADRTKNKQMISLARPKGAEFIRISIIKKNILSPTIYFGSVDDLLNDFMVNIEKYKGDNEKMLKSMAEFKLLEDELKTNGGQLRKDLDALNDSYLDTKLLVDQHTTTIAQNKQDAENKIKELTDKNTDLEARIAKLENMIKITEGH